MASKMAIDVRIDGCDTVSRLFWQRVTGQGDKLAMREKDFGIWNEYDWQSFRGSGSDHEPPGPYRAVPSPRQSKSAYDCR